MEKQVCWCLSTCEVMLGDGKKPGVDCSLQFNSGVAADVNLRDWNQNFIYFA